MRLQPYSQFLNLSFSLDFDHERSFVSYRGGYRDPKLNGGHYPPGNDYYHDYPTRGGRGRPSVPAFRRGRHGFRGGCSGIAVQDPMARGPSTEVVPQWTAFGEFSMLPASSNLSGRGPRSVADGPTATRTGSEEPICEEVHRNDLFDYIF